MRPIVAVRVVNPANGEIEEIYALLDSGADRDYLSERVAHKLGLVTKKKSINLVTVEEASNKTREMADIEIESVDGSYRAEIEEVLVGKFPEATRDVPPAKRDLSDHSHLDGINFIDIEAKVEAIISIAHADAWTGVEIRRGRKDQLIGLKTLFGWSVLGISGKKGRQEAAISLLSYDDKVLREDLQKIFRNDFPEVHETEESWSRETQFAIQQLKETIRFDEEKGKYRVGLPWKEGREKATELINNVDSRSMATKRSWSLRRSMERNPEKKKKAFEEMAKFIDNNRAEKITDDKENDKEEAWPTWHLPCHLVYQKGKYRFCHDGRATVNGFCLNDQLIGDGNMLPPCRFLYRL